MVDRSRLMIDDNAAMPRNIAPVPANASMTRVAPFARPRTAPRSRDSIKPMNNVKASSTGTPAEECLVFSIAKMKPRAPARNTTRPTPGERARATPVVSPIHAPRTVGTMDRARSQYVLRKTRLRCASAVADAPAEPCAVDINCQLFITLLAAGGPALPHSCNLTDQATQEKVKSQSSYFGFYELQCMLVAGR